MCISQQGQLLLCCCAPGILNGIDDGSDLLLQEVDPQIGGVRLSNRPILGPDAGPMPYSTATEDAAPHGIVDKVKQLVGLGPATTTPAVCRLCHKVNSYMFPLQAACC